MPFLTYKTRQDLEQILANGAVENTELEFKDSRALARDEGKITELCINVSALANSNGGQIIYGINENKKSKGPVEVDDGVADATITRDWISQILNARIKPRLTEYSIDPIDLDQGKLGFAISVPQSSIGPHQAPDHKYYRRIGIEVRSMEDYEVRDIMRRATTPELFLDFALSRGDNTAINYNHNDELSQPVALTITLGNRSSKPAFHAVIQVGIHTSLQILPDENWTPDGVTGERHEARRWISRLHSSPPQLPVFKEINQSLPHILLKFHSRLLAGANRFPVDVKIMAPGFVGEETWTLHQEGQHLRMLQPGHPLTR